MSSEPSRPAPRAAAEDAPQTLLLLLLVLAAYADPLLTHRSFIGRDILPYALPLERAVHDAWTRGEVPVWWDAISGGRPLLPNPNAGVFYPGRVALAHVPFPLAMRVFPIAHWFLAGWGMLRLSRSAGGSRAAAWVAAVSFAFSGVLVSEVFYYAFLPGAALLPWSLWALARRARRPVERVAAVGIVYGLMLLAGDVFSLVLAILSAALWILLETPRAERSRLAGSLVVGLIAAGLLALPQVAATALVAPETRRLVSGLRLREVLGFSIPPFRLLELAVPYPFGPTWSMDASLDWGAAAFRRFFATFFVGPIALVGLFRTFRPAPRGGRFARALAFGCIALALVGNLVPRAWESAASPIPLRYPEKFMLGAAFGLALAAGVAVDGLRREGSRGIGILAVAGALALLAVAARRDPQAAGRVLTAAAGAPRALRNVAGSQVAGSLAEAGLLWIAAALGVRLLSERSPVLLGGALALLTIAPVAANRAIAQAADEEAVFPPTPFARAVARRDPEALYRGLDESLYRATALRAASERGDWGGSAHYRESWVYYTQSLWGRGSVFNGDLDAGDFSRFESLREVSYLAAIRSDSAPFFAALSLRYGFRFRDQDPVAGFRPFGGDAFRFWDENPEAKPEVRLLESWREEPGPVQALGALSHLRPGEVVLETDREAAGSARPGSLRILERTPERLVLSTESADPTWLFVLRGHWEHRTVLLDGRRASAVPALLAFSGVRIPAGRHRLDWRENAPGLAWSRWGPVAALVVLAAGLARKGR